MDKEDKINKHKYKVTLSRHRKKLVKLAKKACPWEYGDILSIMLEYFKMVRDYYKLGYNVWGEEADTDPQNNRLNIAEALVSEYEASVDLPDLEREAIALAMHIDRVALHKKCQDPKNMFQEDEQGNSVFVSPFTEEEFSYLNAVDIAEDAHYNNFLELFKTKLRYLWD